MSMQIWIQLGETGGQEGRNFLCHTRHKTMIRIGSKSTLVHHIFNLSQIVSKKFKSYLGMAGFILSAANVFARI